MSVCRLAVWRSVQFSGLDLLLVCPLPVAVAPWVWCRGEGRLETAQGTGASPCPLPVQELHLLWWLLPPCQWSGVAHACDRLLPVPMAGCCPYPWSGAARARGRVLSMPMAGCFPSPWQGVARARGQILPMPVAGSCPCPWPGVAHARGRVLPVPVAGCVCGRCMPVPVVSAYLWFRLLPQLGLALWRRKN